MGNTTSSSSLADVSGFRVLTLAADSPAAHCGLEIFFSFITEVNDQTVEDMDAFFELTRRSENKKIYFTVVNLRTGTQHRLSCIPQQWSGPGLLGASLALERLEDAYCEGLRVVQVLKTSPADLAGLNPKTDYLLGCERGLFRQVSDFDAAMTENAVISVFSSVDQTVRQVRLPAVDEAGPAVGISLGQGALDALPLPKLHIGVGGERVSGGLRILRVDATGPLAAALAVEGEVDFVEPIFTFITMVDGKTVTSPAIFKEAPDTVRLTLWNCRREQSREVTVTLAAGEGRLGATVRSDEHTEIAGIHVLEVFHKSPAELAGLRSGTDYLLASEATILCSLEELQRVVKEMKEETLSLTVYDALTATQRVVVIHPNATWGGDGVLGCDLGEGAVHRVPKTRVIAAPALVETAGPFLTAQEQGDTHNTSS